MPGAAPRKLGLAVDPQRPRPAEQLDVLGPGREGVGELGPTDRALPTVERLRERGRQRRIGRGLVVLDRDYTKVKEQLLAALTNFGNPIIKVVDGNHGNRGELYLVHEWVGGDLQLDQAQLTLQGLFRMWQRPVHIETIEAGKGRLLSFDGKESKSTELTASHPAVGRVGSAKA